MIEKALYKAFGTPTPKQETFYGSSTRYVGFGGARGGSKSHSVRAKATYLGYEHSGIQMLIIRRTLQELRENHTNRLLAAYQEIPEGFRPRYRDSDKEFIFPNGSRLKLGYCDNELDVLQYQGQEYDILFIDEGTQLTETQFIWLDSTVRGVNSFPKRTYVTCNPGGVGHGWVKSLFIKGDYKRSQRKSDYTFIQAKVWDNLPLFMADNGFLTAISKYSQSGISRKYVESVFYDIDPYVENTDKKKELVRQCIWESEYVRMLDSLPQELRKAWLEGDWDVFAGQYFREFHEETHTCDPFNIDGWRKSVSIDYGLDTLAILWFAINDQGHSVCYRGHEAKDLTPSQAAGRVKELSGNDRIEEYIAPPDLWSRNRDTGRSTAEIFAESGIPLIKAGNDRIDGWMNVKEYFKPIDGKPTLQIFNTCFDLIRCIPLLNYDTKKVNDVSVNPHEITHSPDALRYWCSRRQLLPAREEQKKKGDFFDDEPEDETVNDAYFMGGY